MLLFELFISFLLIGTISFGGGYAMISVIQTEIMKHSWMTAHEFSDAVAVASMSPGPIATNCAIIVGYKIAGIPGAIISAIGTVLPSLIMILVIAAFFYKFHEHKLVKSTFYGLRPVITGLILFAAFQFSMTNHVIANFSWHTFSFIAIFAASLLGLMRFKINPIFIILLSGITGMIIFS